MEGLQLRDLVLEFGFFLVELVYFCLGVDVVGGDVVAEFFDFDLLDNQLLLNPSNLVLVLVGVNLLHFLTLPLNLLNNLLILNPLIRQLQLLHMQSMIQILLQLVTFTFEPIMRTLEFMVKTLNFMITIIDDIFQLAVFDLHQ